MSQAVEHEFTPPELSPFANAETAAPAAPAVRPALVITLEMALYLALLALAFVLRVAELDRVAFTEQEATQALAALPAALAGSGVIGESSSPMVTLAQSLGFSLLGGHEFAARIGTALAGIALVFAPLLFRAALGTVRTLLVCALLSASPLLVLASRESSPVVWALLVVIVGGWALWRYWQSGRSAYALGGMTALVAVVLLADPGGWLLVLTLALALAAAWGLRGSDPFTPEAAELRLRWQSFPLVTGVGLVVLTVTGVATGFLLNQRGLGNVGVLLEGAVLGLTQSATDSVGGLSASLTYEPFTWLLALVGVLLLVRRGLSFFDRFVVAWAVGALLALLLWRGGAAYGAWLTVPLTLLASRVALAALAPHRPILWARAPGWARWLVALVTVALWVIFAVGMQMFARSILNLDLTNSAAWATQISPIGVIIVIMSILFAIVGFFLAASVWDNATAAQGAALGVILFGMITSLGAGWNSAVPYAEYASEPYHLAAGSPNGFLLRETLTEVAKRETRGFPTLNMTVVAPRAGLLAWLLRDYTTARWVESLESARGSDVIVVRSASANALGSLGESYVGQTFFLQRRWNFEQLAPLGWLAWWMQRYPATMGLASEVAAVYLRTDVYTGSESVPAE